MGAIISPRQKPALLSTTVLITVLVVTFTSAPVTSICQAQTTKVFLLAGQSNMVGWCYNSTLPQELQQPRPDIDIYWNGYWTYLQPGLGGTSSYFGPEIKLCRDIADAQAGENVTFVKYAVSGTNLWDEWRPVDGIQYINFMNAVDDALLSINEPEIVGMIWMQGESDAYPPHSTLEHAQEYQQNLTNFIQHIRSDFGMPDLPFVIGCISQSPVWTWRDYVRQAQINVNQMVPNTILIDTDDLPLRSDNMHYNTSGSVTLGERFADAANILTLTTNAFSSYSEGDILSWRHAIPQDNDRAVVVGICGQDDDPCDLIIDSVKYDYKDMNEVPGSTQLVFADGKYVVTQLFYLLEDDLPAEGNYKIEIHFSGNVDIRCGGVVTLSGIDQQPPHAVATNSIHDSNCIYTDITVQTNGSWVVDIVSSSSGGIFNTDNGQTKKFNIDGNNITIAGSIKPVISTGLTTNYWRLNDSNCTIAHSATAFSACLNNISGQIRGTDNMPIEGVLVTANTTEISVTTDSNGYYEIPVVHNWFGTVEPVKTGFLFGPSRRSYSDVSDNLAAQDYEDISKYDFDNDGFLGWGDFNVFCENWLDTGENITGDCHKDQNYTVDFRDFADFISIWKERI